MNEFLNSLLNGESGSGLTLESTLVILGAMIVLGLFISGVYMLTSREKGYAPSFPLTLVMMPVIVSIIILLVGSSVARAFSLAGAFSLIRFRSEAGDPRDIAYVFFSVAVGLAGGMGYIGYAALFALVLCAVMAVLSKTRFGKRKSPAVKVRITIPESLNYLGLFDDIMSKYTTECSLQKVKTKEFGSLFELTYLVKLKSGESQKEFIDALRCRNGNLDITVTLMAFEEKYA